MERGFKTYAEDLATGIRKELSRPAHDRLCAFELAEHLGVPTLKFSHLVPAAKDKFGITGSQLQAFEDEVHGMCIPWGLAGRAIIYNDTRAAARQQSDVAHEASHILLGHPMADIVSGAVSQRTKELEDEAATLGGTLLVPKAAAINILRKRMPMDEAAAYYGVSEQLVQWRVNVSGARQIVSRSR